MDDLQEHETSDLRNIGQFCYISSWTDDERESIPMWKMYTDLVSGIRIKLRTEPFIKFPLPYQPPSSCKYTGEMASYISFDQMDANNFLAMNVLPGDLLHKVRYTSDMSKLYPKTVQRANGRISFLFNLLGKYKNPYWAFQREWRYIIYIIPISGNTTDDSFMQNVAYDLYYDQLKQVYPYYDLQIADIPFSDMSITLSPKISHNNHIIAHEPIDQYNPSASIHESSLYELI